MTTTKTVRVEVQGDVGEAVQAKAGGAWEISLPGAVDRFTGDEAEVRAHLFAALERRRSEAAEEERRRAALAEYLGCDVSAVVVDGGCYYHGRAEYSVRTEEEAASAARLDIRESLFGFKLPFLLHFTALAGVDDPEVLKAFGEMNRRLGESANPVWLALLGDRFEAFCTAALASDGRGNFLSSYDGKEHGVPAANGGVYYVTRDA